VALVRYREDIQGRRVLDLGCGAGRLATYLRPLTDHYAGLDVSEHMLAHARGQHPGFTFVQGDMRQLPFEARSFDAVLAVFNLFDAVSHEDRLKVLAEVRHVLTPGGLLFFSAHNRNWAGTNLGPRLHFSRNPISQVRLLRQYLRSVANHRSIKKLQQSCGEYALLNDEAHDFAVLHYYIDREAQARQLAAAGFQPIECLDELGRTLSPKDDDRPNSSIHYVARSGAGALLDQPTQPLVQDSVVPALPAGEINN
jgi:ubiquinone/menaquinone biosynthesis C-methylase UbiE